MNIYTKLLHIIETESFSSKAQMLDRLIDEGLPEKDWIPITRILWP